MLHQFEGREKARAQQSNAASSVARHFGRVLNAQLLHITRQVSKVVLHLPVEPANVAHLALDVLAQCAQRLKLHAASRIAARAAVHLLLVRRARKVLVERVERAELAMA